MSQVAASALVKIIEMNARDLLAFCSRLELQRNLKETAAAASSATSVSHFDA